MQKQKKVDFEDYDEEDEDDFSYEEEEKSRGGKKRKGSSKGKQRSGINEHFIRQFLLSSFPFEFIHFL